MGLRIAILSNAYKPSISGVVTSISLFRRGLIDLGHDVHIFAPKVEDYEDQEPYVFRLPALIDLSKSYDISLALPLKRPMRQIIQGIKPHLIHSQHPVLLGDLATMYAQELDLPLVFTFHTYYDNYLKHNVPIISDWVGQMAREVVQNYLDNCTHIIVPTKSAERVIYQEYKVNAPVSVLPTPIDQAQYRCLDPGPVCREHQLQDKCVLLYLGRISQEKNLGMLLEAFATLAGEYTQLVLMVVGRGPYSDTLQELAESLHIQDQVIFVGAVPHDRVSHYMAAADLFVFPSPSETQGLVLLEALAAGTPVIAVDSLGAQDILAERECGLLVPDDRERFADAIRSLLNCPERMSKMRQSAISIAQDYSVPKAAERLLSIYEAALIRGSRVTTSNVFGIS